MGAGGRPAPSPLSARSRSRRRRAPRAPHIADPVRAASAVLTVACFVALVGLALGPYFSVRAVTVEGAHHLTPDAVRTQSELLGAKLFQASAARARERILLMPAARDARVELALPDAATVTVFERVALGRWISGGSEWFIDAEGVVFGSVDASAAPDARVSDERASRRAGDRIDPALVQAAMRLARVPTGDLRADATSPRVVLAAGPEGLVLRTASFEIRFGGPERVEDKLALARRYLRENPNRKLNYVDVRTPDSIVISPS
jgi:hypothetical protein